MPDNKMNTGTLRISFHEPWNFKYSLFSIKNYEKKSLLCTSKRRKGNFAEENVNCDGKKEKITESCAAKNN